MTDDDPFHVYLLTVALMRSLQMQRTPGTPLGIRQRIEQAEREVDALTRSYLTPPTESHGPPSHAGGMV